MARSFDPLPEGEREQTARGTHRLRQGRAAPCLCIVRAISHAVRGATSVEWQVLEQARLAPGFFCWAGTVPYDHIRPAASNRSCDRGFGTSSQYLFAWHCGEGSVEQTRPSEYSRTFQMIDSEIDAGDRHRTIDLSAADELEHRLHGVRVDHDELVRIEVLPSGGLGIERQE